MPKFLIIRFSSIGDIIQCMGIISGIREHFPEAEIHWITRKDMASFLTIDPRIHKIWAFDKNEGLGGLLRIASQLKQERFDYIYDAHSNIRSNVLKLKLTVFTRQHPCIVVRHKERLKRLLLFRLRINLFTWPFKGVDSFRAPLKKWGILRFPGQYQAWRFPAEYEEKWKSLIDPATVTLVPSANWEMKRWPVGHWQQLIRLLPDYRFVILGGPEDGFCEEIRAVAPERITNLAGKTNLNESCYLVYRSRLVVSADTGLLHAADLFRIPALALMGPTAFGFPEGPAAEILEVPLSCRPCTKDGRGKCRQDVYRKCMVDITPERVAGQIRRLLPV